MTLFQELQPCSTVASMQKRPPNNNSPRSADPSGVKDTSVLDVVILSDKDSMGGRQSNPTP